MSNVTSVNTLSKKNRDAAHFPAYSRGDGGWPDSLPSLSSNNSIGGALGGGAWSVEPFSERSAECVRELVTILTPYHKRVAQTLYSNVERLVSISESIGHVAFLTLTFPDNVTDHKEAYRRFRSFNTNFLAPHPEFGEWVCVKERQKRGAWHYHMVIQVREDVRTGLRWEEIERGRYSSASEYLRSLWADLREALPKYQMGRSELLPVRSNAEAMGRYVGKYISKHVDQRDEEDKGVRLVNYSRGWVKNSVKFAWFNDNAKEWRRKLALFAKYLGCTELYQLTEKLGTGWAYNYSEVILYIDTIMIEGLGVMAPGHQSETITRILENKEKREKKESREIPSLIRRKSKQQIEKEKAKAYIAEILQGKMDLPDLKISKESSVSDVLLSREAACKVNPVGTKQDIEGVPF